MLRKTQPKSRWVMKALLGAALFELESAQVARNKLSMPPVWFKWVGSTFLASGIWEKQQGSCKMCVHRIVSAIVMSQLSRLIATQYHYLERGTISGWGL